jgi:vitamin K-dependent gamma-carboxylase
LLWKPTRKYAFLAVVAFHLTNAYLLSIGIFPWMGIALTALFLPPDWPRRWLSKRVAVPSRAHPQSTRWKRVVVAGLVLYVAGQILFPWRHLLYPGPPAWTEEGQRFAWRMMLRSKTGSVQFLVSDPDSGEHWLLDPLAHLTLRQFRKMSARPDMIHQFGFHIGELMRADGFPNIEVRAIAEASLNGRERRALIDPNVNLAGIPRSLKHATWITPLEPSS